MTAAEVQSRIGAPDETSAYVSDDQTHRRYIAAAYLFPRGLAAQLARRPAEELPPLRGLGLLYLSGRLVRIEVGIGYSVTSGRCTDGRPAPAAPSSVADVAPSDFAPFSRFATLSLGEPIKPAARTLGRSYTVSTAADFRAFDPAPITLGGDDRLASFSISADRLAEFEGITFGIDLRRRAGDCRIDGLTFAPPRR